MADPHPTILHNLPNIGRMRAVARFPAKVLARVAKETIQELVS